MAIAFVQEATFNGTNFTFSGAQTAGNTNFVLIGETGTAVTPSVPNDSAGNAYTLIGSIASAGASPGLYVFASFGIVSASANTNIVGASAGSGGSIKYFVCEYSGLSSTIDGSVRTGSGSSGTAMSTANQTTTNANDLILAIGEILTAGTMVAGTGYTLRDYQGSALNLAWEDQIVTSTGTFSGTFTGPGSAGWASLLVAIQATGGGSVTPTLTAGNIIVTATTAPTVAYEPSLTGTVSVSGTVTNSIAVAPSFTGTANVTGSVTITLATEPALTGLVSVTGAVNVSYDQFETISGTISVTGTVTPTVASTVFESVTGSVLLTGTVSPNIGFTGAGTVSVSGSVTPTYSAATPSVTGLVSVSGVFTPTFSATNVSASGTVSVTGIVSPFYSGGGGGPSASVHPPWYLETLLNT
jgi:hypothetical protein